MVLWKQGSFRSSGKVQPESQWDVPFLLRKRWMLCGFVLIDNSQCLFFKENWVIWSLLDWVKKFPWLLTGTASGCSVIPCTQSSFQKAVFSFLLLCGIPLLVDGVRVHFMNKDISGNLWKYNLLVWKKGKGVSETSWHCLEMYKENKQEETVLSFNNEIG